MFPSDFPLLFTIFFTEQHLFKDWLKTGIVLTFTSMRIVELFLEKSRKSRQIIVEIGKVVQIKFKYQNVAFYRISVEFVYISVVQLARTRSSSHVSVSLLRGLPGLHLSFRVSCLVIFTLINIKSNLNTLWPLI